MNASTPTKPARETAKPVAPSATVVCDPTQPDLVVVGSLAGGGTRGLKAAYELLAPAGGKLEGAVAWAPADHGAARLEPLMDQNLCHAEAFLCATVQGGKKVKPVPITFSGTAPALATAPVASGPVHRIRNHAQTVKRHQGISTGVFHAKQVAEWDSAPSAPAERGVRNKNTGESWTDVIAQVFSSIDEKVQAVTFHVEVRVSFRQPVPGAVTTVIKPVQFTVHKLVSPNETPAEFLKRMLEDSRALCGAVASSPQVDTSGDKRATAAVHIKMGTASLKPSHQREVLAGVLGFRGALEVKGGRTASRNVQPGEFLIFVHGGEKLQPRYVDHISKQHLRLPPHSTLRLFPDVIMRSSKPSAASETKPRVRCVTGTKRLHSPARPTPLLKRRRSSSRPSASEPPAAEPTASQKVTLRGQRRPRPSADTDAPKTKKPRLHDSVNKELAGAASERPPPLPLASG